MKRVISIMTLACVVGLTPATRASAHEFIASKLGAGTLEGGLQRFLVNGAALECEMAYQPTEVLALKTEVLNPNVLKT